MTANQNQSTQPTTAFQRPLHDEPHQVDRVDDDRQRELRRLYRQQQSRLSCPGCGEDAVLF